MTFVFSEVNELDTGLLLEVWEKGMLWDKAIGYHWAPLNTIPFTQEVRNNNSQVSQLNWGDEIEVINIFKKCIDQECL